MGKILLTILSVFTLLILGFSLLLPSKVSVARSVSIAASPNLVSQTLSNFHTWPDWNPYLQDSASVTSKISNDGRKVSLRDVKGRKMMFRLEMGISDSVKVFLRAGKITSDYCFVLRKSGENETFLIWIANTPVGRYPWGKLQGLMLDKLTGPQYEQALDNLKHYIETHN